MNRNDLIKLIETFPEELTSEQIINRLLFIEKVQVGLIASEENDVVPHNVVKEKLAQWQKLNGPNPHSGI